MTDVNVYYVCCHLKDCIYNDGIGCCTLEGRQATACVTKNRIRYTRQPRSLSGGHNYPETCEVLVSERVK